MSEATKIEKPGFVARLFKGGSANNTTVDDKNYQRGCECYRQLSELVERYFEQEEPDIYMAAKSNHFLFKKLHHESEGMLPYADIDAKRDTITFETENPVFASCILTFIAEQNLTNDADASLKMKTNEFGEYAQITLKDPNKEKITDLYTETFPHASRVASSEVEELVR